MKKMSKKIMAICIVIAMMCGLAACGGKGKEEAKDENTLTVWAWDAHFNLYAMEEAAKIYQQKNPDFKLETVEITWDDYHHNLSHQPHRHALQHTIKNATNQRVEHRT